MPSENYKLKSYFNTTILFVVLKNWPNRPRNLYSGNFPSFISIANIQTMWRHCIKSISHSINALNAQSKCENGKG